MEFNGFTEKANEALSAAMQCAMSMGHTYIGSEHILYGLLACGGGVGYLVLENNGITLKDIAAKIEGVTGKGLPTKLTAADFTPRSKRILEMSLSIAHSCVKPLAGTEHLLRALLRDNDCYACTFLRELGANIAVMYGQCADTVKRESMLSAATDEKEAKKKDKDKRLPDILSKYGTDLTESAQKGLLDPCLCRENEIQRVTEILLRRTKNNPCLIGEPGVGKTAIVEGLAVLIAQKKVPQALADKRIYMLDITSMLAGAKYRGDFEERVKSVFDIIAADESYIVFIDEIHNIVGAGAAEGAIDAANILKPLLARGMIRLIGATTVNEYRRYIEKESALERRFQQVLVDEPGAEQTKRIIDGIKDRYEKHHGVLITDEAVTAAIELSDRYIHDRFQPDKAIDLIDEAASAVRLKQHDFSKSGSLPENVLQQLSAEKEKAVQSGNFSLAMSIRQKEKELERQTAASEGQKPAASICREDIERIVSRRTGIPISRISDLPLSGNKSLTELEKMLSEKVIGQQQAVCALAKAIRIGRAGLKNKKGPIGSFIFLGTTGVGKTLCCKALSECLFSEKNALIRFDMSEFMEKHSVSKLIGAPPGYMGCEDGGILIERVRRKPYCVILFDEIEKAHPDVFNLLLQVLEDGVLTDSTGRKADFSNTIIIMTGNIGSDKLTDSSRIGFENKLSSADERSGVMKELKSYFRPEFLGRVDEVIVFNKLSADNLKEIVRMQLEELAKNCRRNKICLQWTGRLVDRVSGLAKAGESGAREIRKILSDNIEDKLSLKILGGEISENEKILLDYDETNGYLIENPMTIT